MGPFSLDHPSAAIVNGWPKTPSVGVIVTSPFLGGAYVVKDIMLEA